MTADLSPREYARRELDRLRSERPDLLPADGPERFFRISEGLDAHHEVGGRWGAGFASDTGEWAWGDHPWGPGVCVKVGRFGVLVCELSREKPRGRTLVDQLEAVESSRLPKGIDDAVELVAKRVVEAFGAAPPSARSVRAQLVGEGLTVVEGIGDELLVTIPGSDTFCVVDVERCTVDHNGTSLTTTPSQLVEVMVGMARPLEGNREVVVEPETAAVLRRLIGHRGELTMTMATIPAELAAVEAEGDLEQHFETSAVEAAMACVRILDRAQRRKSWARWRWRFEPGQVVWRAAATDDADDIHRLAAQWRDGWVVEYRGSVRNRGPISRGYDLGFEADNLAGAQLGVVLGGFIADFALRCTGGRDIDYLVPCGRLPSHWGGALVFYQPTHYSGGPQGYWRVKTKLGGWHARAVADDGSPDGRWFDGPGSSPIAEPMYYLGSGWRTSRNRLGNWNFDETIVQLCQRRRQPGWSIHDVETSLGLTGLGLWPQALAEILEGEVTTQATRREGRASKRALIRVWVPPDDAPRQARAGSLDAQGSTAGAWSAGRKRPKTPMRVVLGLWGMGFGVEAIEVVASAAGEPSSKSALHRLVRQAQDPSHNLWGAMGAANVGAEEVFVGDLAMALQVKTGGSRPLPAEAEALLADLPERSRHFLDVLEARSVLTITDAMGVFDLVMPKAMGGITGSVSRRAQLHNCPIPYEASMVDGERRWLWRGWGASRRSGHIDGVNP